MLPFNTELIIDGRRPKPTDGVGEITCYAASLDGRGWTKPKLGLHEAAGSKDDNINSSASVCDEGRRSRCTAIHAVAV